MRLVPVILGLFLLLSACGASAQLPEGKSVVGVVFNDANHNGVRDLDEKGIAGVRVSNGIDVVKTDKNGHYELPLSDTGFVFVIKPRGWMTPVDEDNLPVFYYRIGRHTPTAPDFPLHPQKEPDQFKIILTSDTQVTSTEDVNFLAHDIAEELIGTDAVFGVTLGDIVFDKPHLFEPLAKVMGTIGIPWYYVQGNHDQGEPTFESVFGPAYYAFDYGPVHFIVLRNFQPLKSDSQLYGRQLEFLKNDLDTASKNQLVVLMTHVPSTEMTNREELFRLIESYPNILALAGHSHTQEHKFLTEADGWNGQKPLHQLLCGTASGVWWTGAPDELGIPHSTMWDGTPNGYMVVSFNGIKYSMRYKVARRPDDFQMHIYCPDEINAADAEKTEVTVNVFAGSERSKVEMRIDGGTWTPMEKFKGKDPYYVLMCKAQDSPNPPSGKKLYGAANCVHLWKSSLPRSLTAGTHVIHVRTTDMFGQTYTDCRIIRVVSQ